MSKVEEVAPKTVTGIIEFTGRDAFRTEKSMLRFIVEMTLRYDLETTVLFLNTDFRDILKEPVKMYKSIPSTNTTAVVITRPILLQVKGTVAPFYNRVRREALDTVNQALSTNVTTYDIQTLVANLTLVKNCLNTSSGNMGTLTDMVPSMPEAEWRSLLEEHRGSAARR
ncbi:hypothetical protein MTO96_024962 [Rhipicephalus appendiculatus]